MSEFDDTVDFEVSDDEEVDEVDFAGEFDMDADMTGFTESDIASFLDTMIDV